MLLALLLVPLLEVVVIIAVAHAIGGWPTFAVLLAGFVVGAWLVRHEGARAWASLQEALTSGSMPSRPLSDAALVLLGGVLIMAPGFLSDVLGLVVVLPFTRPVARRLIDAVVVRRLLAGGGLPRVPPQDPRGGARPASRSAAADDVIEGEVL